MSEIPNSHLEQQPWQQELQLHGEVQGTLRPDETVAIMGSWIEEKLQDYENDYKKGLIEPEDYKDARACRLALAELPHLDIQEVDVRNAIFDREQELKAKRSQVEDVAGAAIDDKLTGLNRLIVALNGIEDTVSLRHSKDIPLYRERAENINMLIEDHNTWVNRSRENSQEIPEAREAQERINRRVQEQITRQSEQPVQTPDDARRKVAEALGDTEEVEKKTLLANIVSQARGRTYIYTDVPGGVGELPGYDGHDGFNAFGDAAESPRGWWHTRLHDTDYPEALIFEPDTVTKYKTVQEEVETGGRFRKKTEQKTRTVPDGELPNMILNPDTGKQEPGVKVSYQFHGGQNGTHSRAVHYEGPAYTTWNNRSGNMLFVEATLPQSVANVLHETALNDPGIARDFAKQLVLNNGISEELWAKVVSPPYDELADNWQFAVTELRKDTQFGDIRHEVASRQILNAK